MVGLVCIEFSVLVGGVLILTGVDGIQGIAAAVLFLGGLILGQELAGTELTVGGFLGALVLAPAIGAVLLLGAAMTAHLLVIVVLGDRHAGFRATLRAISLASVVTLVNWLPVIGLPLNLIGTGLATHGIRDAHGTTWRRAALVGFAPAVAVVVFVAVLRFAPE